MLDTAQARTRSVGEIVVGDSVEALDAALAKAGIEARDIVSIIPIPRITPAIGDYEPKLRVIYRKAGK
jgi:pyruvoyl-dependent arginine decarboxylase (PvlArgDC)